MGRDNELVSAEPTEMAEEGRLGRANRCTGPPGRNQRSAGMEESDGGWSRGPCRGDISGHGGGELAGCLR